MDGNAFPWEETGWGKACLLVLHRGRGVHCDLSQCSARSRPHRMAGLGSCGPSRRLTPNWMALPSRRVWPPHPQPHARRKRGPPSLGAEVTPSLKEYSIAGGLHHYSAPPRNEGPGPLMGALGPGQVKGEPWEGGFPPPWPLPELILANRGDNGATSMWQKGPAAGQGLSEWIRNAYPAGTINS